MFLMPRAHIVTMEYLFSLLHKIIANESCTQMGSHNLARIFSPILLWPKGKLQNLDEMERSTKVLEFIFENIVEFMKLSNLSVYPWNFLNPLTTVSQMKPQSTEQLQESTALLRSSSYQISTHKLLPLKKIGSGSSLFPQKLHPS